MNTHTTIDIDIHIKGKGGERESLPPTYSSHSLEEGKVFGGATLQGRCIFQDLGAAMSLAQKKGGKKFPSHCYK